MTTRNPDALDRTADLNSPAPITGAEVQPDGVAPEERRDYLRSIRENYSKWVAVADIPVGNAVAFRAGDAVNADHPMLEDFKADGLIVARATAEKRAAKG